MTFQYTFTRVIGNVVSLLPRVIGRKFAMERELYVGDEGR